jgi:choice-of-anchor B domain-containing protein
MVDMNDPLNPTFAGCFASDGYTHDAQCVVYQGPDADYAGRELCFNANTDTLTIVDVEDKGAPALVSRTGYSTSAYTHQGWLTEDQRYYVMDDELDEGSVNTRTYIWDLLDLDNPQLIGTHVAATAAIDHNMYVKDGLVYQANYRAGLRILDAAEIANGTLSEVGYFDIYPANDSARFNGAWSSYPYYESGLLVVSGIEQGLYVLRYQSPTNDLYLPAAP